MSGYELKQNGYVLHEGIKSSSGTKKYEEVTGGTDSLPEIGDPFDVDNLGVVVIGRDKEIFGYNEDDPCNNAYMWTISYSTEEPDDSTSNSDTDPNQRTFTIGGEILSIPTTAGGHWWWENNVDELEVDTAERIKDQTLFFANPVGLITFSKEIALDDNDAFLTELELKAGKLNLTQFDGHWSKGNVMFVGASGNLQTKSDGTENWKYILSFKWRTLGGVGSPTTNTWQYVWNKKDDNSNGRWAVPAKDNASGQPKFQENLYDYEDLNSFLPDATTTTTTT